MIASGLTLRYLDGCAPARVEQITVEALGDFPAGPGTLASFDARNGAGQLSALPPEAALFRLRIDTPDFSGVAIARAGAGGAHFDALLLPLGVHCALPTPGLPRLDHAGIVPVTGGDVLIAGGVRVGETTALRDAYRLQVARAEVARDADGMFLPRVLAATVVVDGQSWVLGGTQALVEGSPALDSFERYDAAQGAFTAPGRLALPRARAGAVRLLDGSVLVAGGEGAVDGEALASVERIAVDGRTSRVLTEPLPWPAREPRLFVRDDGYVWVVADVAGALTLALFDPAAESFRELEPPSAGLEASPVVALPGSRLAIVELAEGVTTGAVWLVLPDGEGLRLSRWLTSFAGLSQAQAVALGDGRILLTGVRGEQPTARVIDVGRGEVSVRALNVPIRAFVPRDDGSIVELGAREARIVREDARTRYDNPGGTLLADDAQAVALDAHTRWRREGLELVALEGGASFELGGLLYADVDIALEAEGPGELVLRRTDGAARAISVDDDAVGPALCTLPRDRNQAILVERRDDVVRVKIGDANRSCRLLGMVGPVALGYRALTEGVRLRRLEVTRR